MGERTWAEHKLYHAPCGVYTAQMQAPLFQNEELLARRKPNSRIVFRFDVVDTKRVESDQTTLFFATVYSSDAHTKTYRPGRKTRAARL